VAPKLEDGWIQWDGHKELWQAAMKLALKFHFSIFKKKKEKMEKRKNFFEEKRRRNYTKTQQMYMF